jgi:hypothetical protein
MREVDTQKLEDAVRKLWSAETSFPPAERRPEDPSRGQCAATALIVQDYVGGEIMQCDVRGDHESHFYNRLPSGEILDLTNEQFSGDVVFENMRSGDREKILSYPGTRVRYELLGNAVPSRL